MKNNNPELNVSDLLSCLEKLLKAEELYGQICAYRSAAEPSWTLPRVLTPIDPKGLTGTVRMLVRDLTRLQDLRGELEALLYSKSPYETPDYLQSPEGEKLWRKTWEFFDFDDSE